ncbi:MAG: hypothetical protein ACI8RZ_006802 [Myxococcota bacterium]|jgi:hypothetical protein
MILVLVTLLFGLLSCSGTDRDVAQKVTDKRAFLVNNPPLIPADAVATGAFFATIEAVESGALVYIAADYLPLEETTYERLLRPLLHQLHRRGIRVLTGSVAFRSVVPVPDPLPTLHQEVAGQHGRVPEVDYGNIGFIEGKEMAIQALLHDTDTFRARVDAGGAHRSLTPLLKGVLSLQDAALSREPGGLASRKAPGSYGTLTGRNLQRSTSRMVAESVFTRAGTTGRA